MRDPTAEIRPAVDLAQIRHEWDQIDGREQRTMAEFRAAKTQLLIKARAAFNSRGDGFVDFVEKELRLSFSTASRWMSESGWKPPKQPGAGAKSNHSQTGNEPDVKPLAGHVKIAPIPGEISTRSEAGNHHQNGDDHETAEAGIVKAKPEPPREVLIAEPRSRAPVVLGVEHEIIDAPAGIDDPNDGGSVQ